MFYKVPSLLFIKIILIIILVIAAAIGVLDFVFSRGVILLGDLFH